MDNINSSKQDKNIEAMAALHSGELGKNNGENLINIHVFGPLGIDHELFMVTMSVSRARQMFPGTCFQLDAAGNGHFRICGVCFKNALVEMVALEGVNNFDKIAALSVAAIILTMADPENQSGKAH